MSSIAQRAANHPTSIIVHYYPCTTTEKRHSRLVFTLASLIFQVPREEQTMSTILEVLVASLRIVVNDPTGI